MTAQLSDAQLERLCALVYLNEVLIYRGQGTVGEIIDALLANGLREPLPCSMTEAEWLRVLYDARDDAELSRLRVIKWVDVTETQADGTLPGHRAFAFANGAGNAYAVFRGTSGDEEWHDNALGMVNPETPQQKAALRFVTELAQMEGVTEIITAGHSKGGNKAQYAALTAPEGTVTYGFSVDGQGFSPAFTEKYRAEIEKRKPLLKLIAERRDFINCLGLYANGPAQYHSGRRGGQPLPYFHCPDALRALNGQMGPVSPYAPISAALNTLVIYFLQSPAYEKNRYETASDLVGLMMTHKYNPSEKTAEALVNLIVVFLDLFCHNAAFRQQAKDVFIMEHEVLADTFDSMGKAERHSGLRGHVLGKLARRALADPAVRKNLRSVLAYLKRLILSARPQNRLSGYAAAFTEHLIKGIAAN